MCKINLLRCVVCDPLLCLSLCHVSSGLAKCPVVKLAVPLHEGDGKGCHAPQQPRLWTVRSMVCSQQHLGSLGCAEVRVKSGRLQDSQQYPERGIYNETMSRLQATVANVTVANVTGNQHWASRSCESEPPRPKPSSL
ncbi:hypothetical protein V8C86DRAFT_23051 [Haematococcus lacustris]